MVGRLKLSVQAPCSQPWGSMAGDDRGRFCGHCSRHVHNLSAMSEDATLKLLAGPDDHLCIRFNVRGDGTAAFGGESAIRRALHVAGLIALSLWFWATVVLVQLPWLALTRRAQPAPSKPRQDELDRKEHDLKRRALEERARLMAAIWTAPSKGEQEKQWTAGGISRSTRARVVREANERQRHSKKTRL